MKELIKTISRSEWNFVLIMMVVTILLTGLPFLYGYLTAPSDAIYYGLHALSPGDIPVYYSYLYQIVEGDFFVKDLFTSEAQSVGTFNVWWVGVGLMAKIFSIPIGLAFQLSRILMIPVFMTVAYIFISFFFQEKIRRKTAFIFLLFSGGVGAFFAPFFDALNLDGQVRYWWPIDLWLTEANTFNTLFQTSHFIASITLTLLVFLLILIAFEKKKLKSN